MDEHQTGGGSSYLLGHRPSAHHTRHLSAHEFEQALGVGDGQGSLECCSPWGCKESDMTVTKWQRHILYYFCINICEDMRIKYLVLKLL